MKNVTNKNWTHEDHMRFGVEQGWWSEWDEIGPIKVIQISLGAMIEDALVEHNIFTSKSEARRAGFCGFMKSDPIWIKKKRIKILSIE